LHTQALQVEEAITNVVESESWLKYVLSVWREH
jgi:hypothetical protein